MRIVIVGGVAAGMSAAARARLRLELLECAGAAAKFSKYK